MSWEVLGMAWQMSRIVVRAVDRRQVLDISRVGVPQMHTMRQGNSTNIVWTPADQVEIVLVIHEIGLRIIAASI
jgi:hypothetical protein